MKINKTLAALIAGASLGLSGQAFAAPTAAGIVITNKVSLAYKVDTIQQAELEANSSFQVDHKIDMEIVDNLEAPTIIPGQGISYEYSLTNSGNEAQIYQLNLANSADGAADSGNITIPAVTYALTETPPADTSITESGYLTIPSGATAQYTATFTYPQTLDDGETKIVDGNTIILLATAKAVADNTGAAIAVNTADTDKNTAANLNTKLILFLEAESDMVTADTDAAGNGTISVITTTTAVTANFAHDGNGNGNYTDPEESGPGLTVKVINDPICSDFIPDYDQGNYYADYAAGTVNTCVASAPTGYTPKAIPGALVEYTITAKNTGSVAATDVTLEQDIANPNAGYTDFLLAGTLRNAATSEGTTAVDAGNNKLVVTIDTFAKDLEVIITFTALVE